MTKSVVPEASLRLLQEVRAGHEAAFQDLYRQAYPMVEKFVRRNNGTAEQARDLFQETLLVLLQKVRQPDFTLSCSLPTYLFAISKNRWLKQLKSRRRWVPLEPAVAELLPGSRTQPPAGFRLLDGLSLVLARLTARCQALLNALFLRGKSVAEVVQEHGYANPHTARSQKHKCLVQARREGQRLPDLDD
jgi:RNA polymerase sigma factor (sigma-70 family)